MLHRSSRYDRKPVVRNDLSIEAKQTFQVVALLATILMVGIHYKSDVPDSPDPALATWNELGQEFLFGGVGRVAVPLFSFAAGFFYFRSDDGSLASYRKKLVQRFRSVLFPFTGRDSNRRSYAGDRGATRQRPQCNCTRIVRTENSWNS